MMALGLRAAAINIRSRDIRLPCATARRADPGYNNSLRSLFIRGG